MIKRYLKNILERNLKFLRNKCESPTNNLKFNIISNAIKPRPQIIYPLFQRCLYFHKINKRYSTIVDMAYVSYYNRRYISTMSINQNNATNVKISLWLSMCTGWVFLLIILGGITRLTRSGLSMTEWKFTGERPPMSVEEWIDEFEKYKKSPEYKKVNINITLEEFKFIYWMEYAHRMWGRSLGLIFIIPAIYFYSKNMIDKHLKIKIAQLLLLGGIQGFIGWWMVKSGLEEPRDEWSIPRVSPYRLATHLASAFFIYSILFYTTLSYIYKDKILESSSSKITNNSNSMIFKRRLIPFMALISLTAFSGAFVAGLDAGRCYNTFPKMNDSWIPEDYFKLENNLIQNIFENPAAVQFHHRCLAVTTLISSMIFYISSKKLILPSLTHKLLNGILYVTIIQFSLGIATLLNHVPTSLASLHQAGALTLFTLTLSALHSIRPVRNVSLMKYYLFLNQKI